MRRMGPGKLELRSSRGWDTRHAHRKFVADYSSERRDELFAASLRAQARGVACRIRLCVHVHQQPGYSIDLPEPTRYATRQQGGYRVGGAPVRTQAPYSDTERGDGL